MNEWPRDVYFLPGHLHADATCYTTLIVEL
jgi:hypothetical protein